MKRHPVDPAIVREKGLIQSEFNNLPKQFYNCSRSCMNKKLFLTVMRDGTLLTVLDEKLSCMHFKFVLKSNICAPCYQLYCNCIASKF